VETYLQAVASCLPFLLQPSLLQQNEENHNSLTSSSYQHLGVQSQRQAGLSYIGIVLPLGRLETHQLRSLATLTSQYGSGILRLTPWQNVLLSDVSAVQIAVVQQELEQLGLSRSATHPCSAIVACSGTKGCKSSATNTQADALALATHLEQQIVLDRPVNIHFSGCEKSCAQHHASDITLLGVTHDGHETYHVYVGDDGSKFGRELYRNYAFKQLPYLIEPMLRIYQQRSHSHETFKAFVNRHTIAELKQMLSAFSDCQLMEVRG
jgi:ferredoxin-nitrite reductase